MSSILFLLVAFISEVLGTVGGFGSSVFFVPLAGFFFDFQTVLVITGILHVFSNSAKLIMFYKGINYKLLVLIGIPSVVFVSLGAYLSTHIYSTYTEFALGIFLIIFGALFLCFPKVSVPQNKTNAIAGGSIAGFLSGLFGTGGAIRGLSLASFNLGKNEFIATSAAIDFGVDAVRTIIYLSSAYLVKENYFYIPFLLLVAVTGSYVGKLILNKISQENFKRIVLILIICIGVVMIYKVYKG